MARNLGLTSPVFEIPFDDNTLLVAGRLAIMWGQIVFHLDVILARLIKFTSEWEVEAYEPSP
jgi:hypothetical protein